MSNSNNIISFSDFSEDAYGYYQKLSIQIERIFSEQVAQFPLVAPLSHAVDYALFPPGKRIRPLFACLLCNDLSGDVDALLEVVLALELLHCASLVHDDLPALDDDDMRRGKPSCHKAFSEATAVLTGDVLVALAQSLVSKSSFTVEKKLAFVDVLANAYIELCNGQQLDLLEPAERGELEVVHQLKTGSLFKAACQFAGIAADKNPSSVAALGIQLGNLFQFIDDMLDVFGSNADKGRDKRSDLKNNKSTLAVGINRDIFLRKLNTIHKGIYSTLAEVAEKERYSTQFPKFCFQLEELFERARAI